MKKYDINNNQLIFAYLFIFFRSTLLSVSFFEFFVEIADNVHIFRERLNRKMSEHMLCI
jgi:hypothetical protein